MALSYRIYDQVSTDDLLFYLFFLGSADMTPHWCMEDCFETPVFILSSIRSPVFLDATFHNSLAPSWQCLTDGMLFQEYSVGVMVVSQCSNKQAAIICNKEYFIRQFSQNSFFCSPA